MTANKALVAERGAELAQLIDEHGGALYYEAAVAGGIPAIKGLREGSWAVHAPAGCRATSACALTRSGSFGRSSSLSSSCSPFVLHSIFAAAARGRFAAFLSSDAYLRTCTAIQVHRL